jgi:hypothetical protein
VSKLRAIITNVEKTSEKCKDQYDTVWEKCIIEVEIIGASRRFKNKAFLKKFMNRKVRITRWCAYDWHCKVGSKITLDAEEFRSHNK